MQTRIGYGDPTDAPPQARPPARGSRALWISLATAAALIALAGGFALGRASSPEPTHASASAPVCPPAMAPMTPACPPPPVCPPLAPVVDEPAPPPPHDDWDHGGVIRSF